MFKYKIITAMNKDYYDKNNCKFVLCESCWWFATVLNDVIKISQCRRCKKKKVYVERIIR
jgi:CO dehydrogenase/acetyl-CoA synthase gamma subunit (corrinoid Fe-S protein)